MDKWKSIKSAPKDGRKIIAKWTSRKRGAKPIIIETEYYFASDGDEFWWPRLSVPDTFKPTSWVHAPV